MSKRDKVLSIRMSADEYARLRRSADRFGLSLSEYVRRESLRPTTLATTWTTGATFTVSPFVSSNLPLTA